jgi:hypothetical protein
MIMRLAPAQALCFILEGDSIMRTLVFLLGTACAGAVYAHHGWSEEEMRAERITVDNKTVELR